MEELKPCPFCGSEAHVREGCKTGLWFIDCKGMCMDFCRQTKEEAIKDWNTRKEN